MNWKRAIPTEVIDEIVAKMRKTFPSVEISADEIAELIQASASIDDAKLRICQRYALANADQLDDILSGIGF